MDSYDLIWVIQIIKFKKKSAFYVYFYIFFLLKYIMCDKLHHFMRKKKSNILHQIMV